MSICNKCGTQNQDDAVFCSSCGNILEGSQDLNNNMNASGDGLVGQSQHSSNNVQNQFDFGNQSQQTFGNSGADNGQYTNQSNNNQQYNNQYQQTNDAWNSSNGQPDNWQGNNYQQNQNYNQVSSQDASSAANMTLLFGILSCFLGGYLWLILSIVYFNKAKKAKYDGSKATVGLVLAIVGTVLWTVLSIVIFRYIGAALSDMYMITNI